MEPKRIPTNIKALSRTSFCSIKNVTRYGRVTANIKTESIDGKMNGIRMINRPNKDKTSFVFSWFRTRFFTKKLLLSPTMDKITAVATRCLPSILSFGSLFSTRMAPSPPAPTIASMLTKRRSSLIFTMISTMRSI